MKSSKQKTILPNLRVKEIPKLIEGKYYWVKKTKDSSWEIAKYQNGLLYYTDGTTSTLYYPKEIDIMFISHITE